jgi:hypothetical protein
VAVLLAPCPSLPGLTWIEEEFGPDRQASKFALLAVVESWRSRCGLTLVTGHCLNFDLASCLHLRGTVGFGRFDVAPILEGYRNIVTAIQTHQVGRLVALGTPSITDPADRREPALLVLVAVGKRIKPAAYRTMVGIGEIVRASELDWTIVRVPLLTDGPRTERIDVRPVGNNGSIRLSRANAAAYFLQQAQATTRIGQAPLITDIRPREPSRPAGLR